MWQGLIAVADDQGRLPGMTAFVRSQVWPYDDILLIDVEEDLKRLIELGMILRYEVEGSIYIQIVNWWKYQTPQWAGPSDFPPPDGWMERMRYHGAEHKVITVNWEKPGGFTPYISEPPDKPPDEPPSKHEENQAMQEEEEEGKDKEEVEEELIIGAGAPLPDPLAPDTPGALAFFEILGREFTAKKRKVPEKFTSYASKQKFLDDAEGRLTLTEIKDATTRACEKNITSIVGAVDFVAKWDTSGPPSRNGRGPASKPVSILDNLLEDDDGDE